MNHGRGGYSSGCRCDACRTAQRDYQRDYYRSKGGNLTRQPRVIGPCRVCGDRIAHYAHTEPVHRRCAPRPGDVCVWQEGPCGWCGQRFTSTANGHRRHCSYRCVHAAGDARRRARRAGATGEFTWAEITRLWLAFGRACAYCRQPTSEYEPDHVVPLSKGGSNALPNLLPCCPTCNRQKRAHLLPEWMQWRTERGMQPYTPWVHEPHLYTHLTTPLPTVA